MLPEAFGADTPVFAAPMAGGPTTPALVAAAASAGSFGFLAAGYRTADDLADQLAQTRQHTERFGVNLFVPQRLEIDASVYSAYRERLLPLAARYEVELPAEAAADDDGWLDKLDVLLESPPPVVSFTFGVPDIAAVNALRRAGVLLAQTVTSVDEALLAQEAGFDLLVLQAPGAGGHSGTLTPERPLADIGLAPLVSQVSVRTSLPVIAGGGVGTASDVEAALIAGAAAVAVGTALLLAPEAGTSATHQRALATFADRPTTITRAFTGRPARGIRNEFIDAYPDAPLGYPALHHLTQPIRRAAAAAGCAEHLHLWAGTAFTEAVARPAAETLSALVP
ncbi:MAG: nitronate monooxygenase [Marmoricola sp.]